MHGALRGKESAQNKLASQKRLRRTALVTNGSDHMARHRSTCRDMPLHIKVSAYVCRSVIDIYLTEIVSCVYVYINLLIHNSHMYLYMHRLSMMRLYLFVHVYILCHSHYRNHSEETIHDGVESDAGT